MFETILNEYGFNATKPDIIPFGTGLINKTWKVVTKEEGFILQRLNTEIFKTPELIAENIYTIKEFLDREYPDYLLPVPIETISNKYLTYDTNGNCYRLIPFVQESHTIDVVSTADEAFEAASQFGIFTNKLSQLQAEKLHTTIPEFHNLILRFSAFQQAIKSGSAERIKTSTGFIKNILAYSFIVDAYEAIKKNPSFKIRVTHHDTKISNVLFNKKNKGICVIDLDTVMPGYFISDLGDMMRTYLCPLNEESDKYDDIEIRDDYYNAIVDGYCTQMQTTLTNEEKNSIFYAGTFLIYMQTLRFITDYLLNDSYYGAKYPTQNLVRAQNQFTLLKRYLEKESQFSRLQ